MSAPIRSGIGTCIVSCAMLSGSTVLAAGTEEQVIGFEFPPNGAAELTFAQFNDENGSRHLDRVDVDIYGVLISCVSVFNEGDTPIAPGMELRLSGDLDISTMAVSPGCFLIKRTFREDPLPAGEVHDFGCPQAECSDSVSLDGQQSDVSSFVGTGEIVASLDTGIGLQLLTDGGGDVEMTIEELYTEGRLTVTYHYSPVTCAEDLDGSNDGEIEFSDLVALLGEWGECPTECSADFDESGEVDFGDLTRLLGAWGSCPAG